MLGRHGLCQAENRITTRIFYNNVTRCCIYHGKLNIRIMTGKIPTCLPDLSCVAVQPHTPYVTMIWSAKHSHCGSPDDGNVELWQCAFKNMWRYLCIGCQILIFTGSYKETCSDSHMYSCLGEETKGRHHSNSSLQVPQAAEEVLSFFGQYKWCIPSPDMSPSLLRERILSNPRTRDHTALDTTTTHTLMVWCG